MTARASQITHIYYCFYCRFLLILNRNTMRFRQYITLCCRVIETSFGIFTYSTCYKNRRIDNILFFFLYIFYLRTYCIRTIYTIPVSYKTDCLYERRKIFFFYSSRPLISDEISLEDSGYFDRLTFR